MPPWCLNSTALWQINHYAVWMTYGLTCQAELHFTETNKATHKMRAICIINSCKCTHMPHVSKPNIKIFRQYIITANAHVQIYKRCIYECMCVNHPKFIIASLLFLEKFFRIKLSCLLKTLPYRKSSPYCFVAYSILLISILGFGCLGNPLAVLV